MKQMLITTAQRGLAGMMAMTVLAAPLQAETITIGKGSGIMWEGMPFNAKLEGPLSNADLNPAYGLLSISSSKAVCQSAAKLQKIGGYLALPLSGVPGVGLVPRSSGRATYVRSNYVQQELNGTIGLPKTEGKSTSQTTITSPSTYEWCLPPSTTAQSNFYLTTGARTATLSGNWVLVADGTQRTGEATVPQMYFGSYSTSGTGDRSTSILPTDISLRISTLDCVVNTPTAINFGAVNRNTQVNAELVQKTVQLITTCGQPSDQINANINLQFRALSGLYGNTPSRLALKQGGGYITGEIDNTVSGSGACNSTSGVRFDSTAVKLGNITSGQSSKTFNNQLTWRLCSGGNSLPSGAVTASTEMLVTFN